VPADALTALRRRAILIGATLALLGLLHLRLTRTFTIADVFLFQDVPALVLIGALLFALPWLPAGRETSLTAWFARPASARLVLWTAVALAVVLGALGWGLVFCRYPLSLDEFWARFDTQIFARGQALAPVPEPWRPFAAALQPMWRMEVAGDSHWASLYLPVNAAVRALFRLLHAEFLASAAWAGLACALTWRLARGLWPERPDAAVVATVLLAASSQVLVTAMTPYAMSAHLALNLAWLCLFLDDRPWSRLGAAAVGFLACGLHQLIFHPLFVAPFVLELWLSRRWGRAAFYTGAYALICGFWTLYWPLVLGLAHAQAASSKGVGAGFLLARVVQMLGEFDPMGVGLMAKNLLRLIAWQHPLTLPLLLAALPGAAVAKGPLRPLLWGLVLTLAAMLLLLPAQGLGWGYRYLHGLLGSLALLGAQGWLRLTEAAGPNRLRTAFAATTAAALLVLLPLHLWQAQTYATPYARADAAIHARDADVVVVDPTGLRYGVDLVRNDPFLEGRPKVVDLYALTPDGLARLCASGSVGLFERAEGLALGVPALDEPRGAEAERLRAQLSACRR
jgi:hypothetical protein